MSKSILAVNQKVDEIIKLSEKNQKLINELLQLCYEYTRQFDIEDEVYEATLQDVKDDEAMEPEGWEDLDG